MRRILMGEFGGLLGQAIHYLLGQVAEPIAVTSADRITLPLLDDVRPDVIIVDLDNETIFPALSGWSAACPQTAVVACSAVEPFMVVFPAHHGGEFYLSALTVEAFEAVVLGRSLAPPPSSTHSEVIEAAQLRLTAKLVCAWSRRTRSQAAALRQRARAMRQSVGKATT